MNAVAPVTTFRSPEAVKVPEAALKAVATNSLRHLVEANQHVKAANFPSAMSSVVLSIEEAGKLGFLASTGAVPTRGNKHATNSILFFALLAVVEGLTTGGAQDWRAILRCEDNQPDLALTPRQQQEMADHPEVAEFVRRVRNGELPDKQARVAAWAAAFVAKEQRDGTSKRWEPLITRGLQALRLGATYVDVNPSTGTWTDPNSVDAELVRCLCGAAYGLLLLVVLLTRHTRPTIELEDLAGSIPEDLIGQKEIHEFIQKLNAASQAESSINAA